MKSLKEFSLLMNVLAVQPDLSSGMFAVAQRNVNKAKLFLAFFEVPNSREM